MNIAGLRVLVTGASSGIGRSLAVLLAEQRAIVGIVARREDRLREVLEQCRVSSPESQMWAADLGDLDLAEQVALEAWDAFGHLDVVVNNAAIPKRRAVQELTSAEVERVMRINFLSPARMTLAVLPRMLARDQGTIVNVSSVGGRLGIAHEAAYCASKFALCGWSESMAVDLFDTGVRVKLVEPGPIDTEIWDQPDNDPALMEIPKFPPSDVAEGIIAALSTDQFEHYLPDMKAVVDGKNANIDGFIAGTASMTRPRS